MSNTNRPVELKGYYNYDSGGPYRIWTLTRDVPELPAMGQWVEDVGGPRHAAKGDELREDRSDRGKVFRLERDDMVIGRPEWWLVGDLVFGGVWPAWKGKGAPALDPAPDDGPVVGVFDVRDRKVEGTRVWRTARSITLEAYWGDKGMHPRSDVEFPAGTRIVYDTEGHWGGWWYADGRKVEIPGNAGPLVKKNQIVRVAESDVRAWMRADRVQRTPRYRRAASAVLIEHGSEAEGVRLAYVNKPIPEFGIEAGDLLVYAHNIEDRPQMMGPVREFGLDDLPKLREVLEEIGDDLITDLTPWLPGYRGRATIHKFISDQRKWGQRLREFHSRLLHLKPMDLTEPVTAPIEAPSDLHALFELVTASGGRLTNEGRV